VPIRSACPAPLNDMPPPERGARDAVRGGRTVAFRYAASSRSYPSPLFFGDFNFAMG